MFTKEFWKAAFERGIKAAANATFTSWVVGDKVFNAFDADWHTAAGIFAGGFVVSILLSLGSDAVSGGGPSITNAEVVAPPTP